MQETSTPNKFGFLSNMCCMSPKENHLPALAKANASEAWSMDFHTEGYQHVRTRKSSTS